MALGDDRGGGEHEEREERADVRREDVGDKRQGTRGTAIHCQHRREAMPRRRQSGGAGSSRRHEASKGTLGWPTVLAARTPALQQPEHRQEVLLVLVVVCEATTRLLRTKKRVPGGYAALARRATRPWAEAAVRSVERELVASDAGHIEASGSRSGAPIIMKSRPRRSGLSTDACSPSGT